MPAWIDLLNERRVEHRSCRLCGMDTQDHGCGSFPEHELCCPEGVAEIAAGIPPDQVELVRRDARHLALAFCDDNHPLAVHWRMVSEAMAAGR